MGCFAPGTLVPPDLLPNWGIFVAIADENGFLDFLGDTGVDINTEFFRTGDFVVESVECVGVDDRSLDLPEKNG